MPKSLAVKPVADRAGEVAYRVAGRDPRGIQDRSGIPPEQRERIFHVFTSTKKGGTGLGLPTALRIAEEHGGKLILSTETGMGTQFRLRLPVPK